MGANLISQRELRNDSAAVLRRVEGGEDLTVTRRGVPVARLSPYSSREELVCLKPATKRIRFSKLRRVSSTVLSEQILQDLRDER
ncbi:type II toxin-antitoxin system Phd/YefM family antitoxin [Actinomyces mediterranea]|uniref:type II toxin-antitoxin system Phd/YefM family antitoxin n=1 Tax=Actinomyces mediterranea TaxID=1871028 RepID=UPI0009705192|nr:type II toxin-antitoxin system prevent-host-death family antitoxin [Actinomyces mediterranea]